MLKYKIIGRKYQDYYTYVEAEDLGQAYEIANKLDTHLWNELETDDVIEPTEVFLDEQSSENLQLNNDEWPELASGIVITGTN